MSKSKTRFALAALLIASVVALLVWQPDVYQLLREIRSWGLPGALAFAALYVAASILLVPGSILTLGAGFLYGVAGGFAVVFPSSLLAAVISFSLSRWVANDWMEARYAKHPRLRAIEHAVSTNGGSVVMLLRLSPVIPFSALNYLLGLTRLNLRQYTLASAIGMLPGTLAYVYIGSLADQLLSLPQERSAARPYIFGVGLALTLVTVILISRRAQKALASHI